MTVVVGVQHVVLDWARVLGQILQMVWTDEPFAVRLFRYLRLDVLMVVVCREIQRIGRSDVIIQQSALRFNHAKFFCWVVWLPSLRINKHRLHQFVLELFCVLIISPDLFIFFPRHLPIQLIESLLETTLARVLTSIEVILDTASLGWSSRL